MLFDWNEDDILSEYGPYIAAHMQPALEKNTKISGGTTYGIGFDIATDANQRQDIMYEWDLRWDLYKELGYPEIKNLDDMVDVLAQMKELCPTDDNGKTTYGVSLFADWDGDMVMFVKSTASAYFGYDEFGIGLYDSDKQEYHPCLEENGPYLTALKFYNTLYQKGLLDPDSQTQGYDGMVEDYQNGTAFMNVFNFLGSSLYNSEAHTSEGKMMAPCPPSEAEPIAYGQNIYGGNRPWTIGANTEYPELCMAIINWLATPEGRMTLEYGPRMYAGIMMRMEIHALPILERAQSLMERQKCLMATAAHSKMETSRSTIQHGHLIQQILTQRLARLITTRDGQALTLQQVLRLSRIGEITITANCLMITSRM